MTGDRGGRGYLTGLVLLMVLTLVAGACQTSRPAASPSSGVSATSAATAAATPAVVKGGSLRIGMGSEPLSFDPPNYKATTDLIVTRLIFDGLVAFDEQLKIVPGLATKWQQRDETTWRFELRKGVKFADGAAFSAKDVKASLERGAKKPRGQAFIGFIQQVDVIDDFTVDVKTKTPFGPFLQHMATPVAVITSEAATKLDDAKLALEPLGTGAFKLKQLVPKQRAVLARNENYWGDAPLLDEVAFHLVADEAARFAALRSGQLDVIESPPPQDATQIEKAGGDLTLIKSPATRDVRIGFQVQNETLKNVKLRAAIAHAIDAKSIVNFVVEGMARPAENGWLPSEVFAPQPAVSIPFDRAKAKQLLAEAGHASGLTLELVTPQGRYLRDKEIAEAVQQQLREIGITVKVKVMEWGAFLDYLNRHEAQMFVLGWGSATGDPAIASRQNFHSTSAFNWHNFKEPAMDAILEQAERTTDQGKRRALYQDMTKMIFDQYLMKPIYWKLNLFAAHKKVKGFVATPLELVDVTRTWIDNR